MAGGVAVTSAVTPGCHGGPGRAPRRSNQRPARGLPGALPAWVANATWNARPEHDSRVTNIHSFSKIPATCAWNSPKPHMMPDRQLPDRHTSGPPVPPDLLEQLPPRPRHPDLRADNNDAKIRPTVGPQFATTRRPTRQARSPPRRDRNPRRQKAKPGPVQVITLRRARRDSNPQPSDP